MSYEVRQIKRKGQGVVATRRITQGSVILTDKPILSIDSSDFNEASVHRAVEDAFHRLSKQDKATYLSLHDGRQDRPESKTVRIFYTNAFGAGADTKYVLPTVSRLNHSCMPNAVILAHKLYAQKDILPGEEIQLCYQMDCDEVMTAAQRNFLFKWRYGFECKCKACLPGNYQRLSDARRVLIGALRFALEKRQPAGFRDMVNVVSRQPDRDELLESADWPPKPPLIEPVKSPSQEIEYTFLLAMLREAEGLSALKGAETFCRAAGLLLDHRLQYEELDVIRNLGVLFLEAIRCNEAWMNRAIEHAARVQGPTGVIVTQLRKTMHHMQSFDVVVAARQLGKPDTSGGDQKKKCYAVVVDLQMKTPPKYLTLSECEKLFERK